MKCKLLIALMISSLTLSGCVGVWVLSEGRRVNAFPDVKLDNTDSDKNTINRPSCCQPKEFQTNQSILRQYGKPDEVEKSGNKEIWRYDDEVGWSGAVLVLAVVPLPFIIPSMRSTVYEFEGEQPLLRKSYQTYTKISGCGIIAVLYTWIGCDSI